MSFQNPPTRERRTAVVAAESQHVCVAIHVLSEVSTAAESYTALSTGERPDTGVDRHMSMTLRHRSERHVTAQTSETSVLGMLSYVTPQGGQRCPRRAALDADVRLLARVKSYVHVQHILPIVHLVAAGILASERLDVQRVAESDVLLQSVGSRV